MASTEGKKVPSTQAARPSTTTTPRVIQSRWTWVASGFTNRTQKSCVTFVEQESRYESPVVTMNATAAMSRGAPTAKGIAPSATRRIAVSG